MLHALHRKARKPQTDAEVRDGLEDDREIVSTVKRIWTDGRQRMYARLAEWADNLCFFNGQHYARRGYDPYTWYVQANHPEFAQLSINLLRSHMMGWVSRHTHNQPSYQTFPRTGDENDKDRADVVNRIVEWQGDLLGFPNELLRAVILTGIFGCAFLKGWFDDLAGPLVHPQDKQFQLLDGDREMFGEFPDLAGAKGFDPGMMGMQPDEQVGTLDFESMVPKGRVTGKAVAPYEITIAGDWAREMRDVRRMIHSYPMSIEEIKERFHDAPEIDQIQAGMKDESQHQLFFMEDTVRGVYGDLGFSRLGEGGESEDSNEPLDSDSSAIVHELWGTRTPKRPLGVFAVVCGDVLLWPHDVKDLENPYYHTEMPFTMLEHTPDEVSFYPTSDLEQAKRVQREYSERISKMIDSANRTANPPLIAEKGHGINFDDVLGVAGEVLSPQPGRQIKYLEPPQLPPYVMDLARELRFAIEEIFSDHKPSQGVSQKGDSGVKVQALQAADEARHAPFGERLGSAISKFWLQQVCLLAQYADPENEGYLMGDEGERMFFTWRQDQLLGDTAMYDDRARVMLLKEGLDLRASIVPGKSPVTVARDLQFMLETGILNPQDDRKKILEILGYGFDSRDVLRKERQHASMAAQENDKWTKGEEILPPAMYEQHVAHIESHTLFTNTEKFRAADDMAKRAFMLHVAEHEKAIIREQLRMQYLGQAVAMELQQQFGPLMMGGPPPTNGQGQPPPSGRGGGPSPQPGRRTGEPTNAPRPPNR